MATRNKKEAEFGHEHENTWGASEDDKATFERKRGKALRDAADDANATDEGDERA